jgi:hypothetical protein
LRKVLLKHTHTKKNKTLKGKMHSASSYLADHHTDTLNSMLRTKFKGRLEDLRYAVAHTLYDCFIQAGNLEALCEQIALACHTDRVLRADVMALIFEPKDDIEFARVSFEKMKETAETLENCAVGQCFKRDERVVFFAKKVFSSVLKDQQMVRRFLRIHRQPDTAMQALTLNLSRRDWGEGAVVNEKNQDKVGYSGDFANTMYDVSLGRECLQLALALE